MSTNYKTLPNYMRWFTLPFPREKARIRLFCFPYAGSGADIFRDWPKELHESIEVVPVVLPGRGPRLGEIPYTSMETLVEELFIAIQHLLDRPFAFFGHSFGALAAFELARRLQAGGVLAKSIFLSACPAPPLPAPTRPVGNMSDNELTNRLLELGGTSEEVMRHQELLQLVLPAVRADFEIIESYQFRPCRLLQCRFLICGGDADLEVPPHLLGGWRQHTAAGAEIRLFQGDHFFLARRAPELLEWISQRITMTLNERHEK